MKIHPINLLHQMNKNTKLTKEERLLFEAAKDILKLNDILRDAQYGDMCRDSNHKLLFCTVCNPKVGDAIKRINAYEKAHPPSNASL